MEQPPKLFETDRLVLRWLSEADAEFILKLVNEPLWLRFVGDREVRTLDEARAYIERGPASKYQTHGHGLYRVELKSTGEPVGICGLIRRESLPDADLGFAILEEFHRRGYAYEAASYVMEHERPALGFSRVVAITTEDNHASAALLERLGFRFEGIEQIPGDDKPLRLFAATFES